MSQEPPSPIEPVESQHIQMVLKDVLRTVGKHAKVLFGNGDSEHSLVVQCDRNTQSIAALLKLVWMILGVSMTALGGVVVMAIAEALKAHGAR